MELPDTITRADDAAQLLNEWLDAQHERAGDDYAMQFILMSPVQSQYRRSAAVQEQLANSPGPGPAVSSSLRGLIGDPQPRSSGSYVVNEPQRTAYGVDGRGEPLQQLASIVADVFTIRALADRAAACADSDRAADRPRAAGRWQLEADALRTYAAELDQLVEPIAAPVLDDLRAQHERQAAKHPSPLVRSVRLR